MQLHLFSVPGEPFLRNILSVARPLLAGKRDPRVLYLPAAVEGRHYIRETKAAFRGIAGVTGIRVESISPDRLHAVLEQADLLYIPGGNTYLIAHHLHTTGVMRDLRQQVLGGLPLVAFSAGAVLCGPDILTTNDENDCGCAAFDGLGLVPFNLNVHFPPEGPARAERESRLRAFAAAHHRPVLALEEEAYVRVVDGSVQVIQGACWWFEKDCPPVRA